MNSFINLFVIIGVGNIPANINPAVLRSLFQSFGSIESIRILSHKNCGFVNFERQEDAVRARKQMQNKEILGSGTGIVRVGFAKAPTNNPGEVIEDVVISGNTITSYATPATTAAKAAAAAKKATSIHTSPSSSSSASTNALEVQSSNDTTQWATVMLMASMMMNAQKQQQNGASTPTLSNTPSSTSSSANLGASNNARLASERMMIMQQLGYETKSEEGIKSMDCNVCIYAYSLL
jgi:RNA recognition motif-containing protein